MAMTQTTATILERAVCLTFSCHYLGNHRKVKLGDLVRAGGGDLQETGSAKLDEKQFHATKRLIDSKQINPVLRVQSLAKAYLRSRAIVAHRVFGDRSYLIPIVAIAEVDQALQGFQAQLRAAAEALGARYATAIADQREKLGPLFNWADYLNPQAVVDAFAIEWDYIQFAAPEKLEIVDKALFEAIRARYDGKMAEAYEEVRLVLRETLRQLVSGIAKKLQPGPDGGPRVFRNSILRDLTDYLETFAMRNIADDTALATVVSQLKALTAGLQPDQLREFEIVRAHVATGLAQAQAALDGLVAETGSRAISLSGLAVV